MQFCTAADKVNPGDFSAETRRFRSRFCGVAELCLAVVGLPQRAGFSGNMNGFQ
jgi:hypothetical protein